MHFFEETASTRFHMKLSCDQVSFRILLRANSNSPDYCSAPNCVLTHVQNSVHRRFEWSRPKDAFQNSDHGRFEGSSPKDVFTDAQRGAIFKIKKHKLQ